jgi:hypothetical protein
MGAPASCKERDCRTLNRAVSEKSPSLFGVELVTATWSVTNEQVAPWRLLVCNGFGHNVARGGTVWHSLAQQFGVVAGRKHAIRGVGECARRLLAGAGDVGSGGPQPAAQLGLPGSSGRQRAPQAGRQEGLI